MLRTMYLLNVALCSLAIIFFGCGGDDSDGPFAEGHNPQAIVANGTSDNISTVDLITGSVSSSASSIIGPNAYRVKIRGDKAYIVNSGTFQGSINASVKVYDLNSKTVTNTIPFDNNLNPMDIAFVSDTKAYVTCLYGNNVTVIDPTKPGSSAILKTIALPVFNTPDGPVNAGPTGIVISGQYAYTANSGFNTYTYDYVDGSVSIIDTETNTIAYTTIYLPNGINAQDLDVDSLGRIWVVCTGNYGNTRGILEVIDPGTRTVSISKDLGGNPMNITIGGNIALIGIGAGWGEVIPASLYAARIDTQEVLYDSSNPFVLENTPGNWLIGKISITGNGLFGYVPSGIYGTEAKLFEISLQPDNIANVRLFNLAPAANFPSAAALWE